MGIVLDVSTQRNFRYLLPASLLASTVAVFWLKLLPLSLAASLAADHDKIQGPT